MKIQKNTIIKIFIILLLFFWYGFLTARPININFNDLGRLLKNGELIVSGLEYTQAGYNILNSNFYSYTHPNFPFINHHWLSGVIFYVVWSLSGFFGLHLFFIIINFITFAIFFNIGVKKSSFAIAAPIAFFLIPLIALRNEVRPEMFSYLFLGIFFWVLMKYRDNQIYKLLYLLPFVFLLWVNLHIYFIFGLFLIVIFLLEGLYLKRKNYKYAKKLGLVLFLCILAGLLNPAGLRGLLYPFNIFNNYGIVVIENLPIFRFKTLFKSYLPYVFITSIFITTFVMYIILFTKIIFSKKLNKDIILYILLILSFAILSWAMIRNVFMYTLVSIALLPAIIKISLNKHTLLRSKKFIISFAIIILAINYNNIKLSFENWGLGFMTGSDDAANFIIKNNIHGPLFNSFDAGGYITFYLYPEIKPFTDNRPEAYPADFLQKEFVSVIKNQDDWEKISKKYNFNIVLSHSAKNLKKAFQAIDSFEERTYKSPDWALVFKNNYHTIFLKRTEENRYLIEKFEITGLID